MTTTVLLSFGVRAHTAQPGTASGFKISPITRSFATRFNSELGHRNMAYVLPSFDGHAYPGLIQSSPIPIHPAFQFRQHRRPEDRLRVTADNFAAEIAAATRKIGFDDPAARDDTRRPNVPYLR